MFNEIFLILKVSFISSPPWGKLQAKSVCLGIELYHLGRGVIWVKWNCSSYPRQYVQTQIFLFFFIGVLEILLDFWTPTKVLLSMVIIKIGVPWREISRKLLFHHFADVSLYMCFISLSFIIPLYSVDFVLLFLKILYVYVLTSLFFSCVYFNSSFNFVIKLFLKCITL